MTKNNNNKQVGSGEPDQVYSRNGDNDEYRSKNGSSGILGHSWVWANPIFGYRSAGCNGSLASKNGKYKN